jgi:hypothetical protein
MQSGSSGGGGDAFGMSLALFFGAGYCKFQANYTETKINSKRCCYQWKKYCANISLKLAIKTPAEMCVTYTFIDWGGSKEGVSDYTYTFSESLAISENLGFDSSTI